MTHLNAVQIRGIIASEPKFYNNLEKKQMARVFVRVDRRPPSNAKDYFDVVAWGDIAETIHREFTMNSAIDVLGRLRKTFYTDKNGEKISQVEIVADQVCHPIEDLEEE